jgi:hypothetical protein
MIEVKLNKQNSNNPFYGMRNLLTLNKDANGGINVATINEAYNEAKGNKEKLQLFYSVLFSIGDITARQHNIFKGVQKDNGGNSNRDGFATVIDWMWQNQREQFIAFLNAGLFNEYTCFDHLLTNRVKTNRDTVLSVSKRFSDAEYRKVIVEYLYKIINGQNEFNKLLVAKFLSLPRLSKRKGHERMLKETKENMKNKCLVLAELSKLMGWDYIFEKNICNFKGYRAWRKQFNSNLESVIFSTNKIKDFDKVSFIDWFDKLPAQARFRVKNRILYSKNADETPKYPQLQEWYKEWNDYKEEKQQEQRELEEKIRQGQASEEDVKKLQKVKKEAKVTVGATNFSTIFEQIGRNDVDALAVQSFMDKINLPYNSLVIIDDSGSMSGAPIEKAAFIAAACLYKNPDDTGRNLIGLFNTTSRFYNSIDEKVRSKKNSLVRSSTISVENAPFIDGTKSFIENYNNIRSFILAKFQSGCTDISSIADSLAKVSKDNPEIIDVLKEYPVWTIISDGEWNNLPSPESSMNDLFKKCEMYLGFRPFIVAIDVSQGWRSRVSAEQFSGIENMIYINNNVAQIEQFLTNFKDMDIFDVYTPLESLFRSNRYELVRNNVL